MGHRIREEPARDYGAGLNGGVQNHIEVQVEGNGEEDGAGTKAVAVPGGAQSAGTQLAVRCTLDTFAVRTSRRRGRRRTRVPRTPAQSKQVQLGRHRDDRRGRARQVGTFACLR